MSKINIESASVKVMRSFDYCHFEVCLSTNSVASSYVVDELRKEAARLADKAVSQYKIAKRAAVVAESMSQKYQLDQAEKTPENERSPEQKAIIKYHSDAVFASQFDYDYEDGWEQP